MGVTAPVLRLVNILRRNNSGNQGSTHKSKQFIMKEIDNTKKLWIRSLQAKKPFLAELVFLQLQNKQMSPIQIYQFRLFIDHGDLHCCWVIMLSYLLLLRTSSYFNYFLLCFRAVLKKVTNCPHYYAHNHCNHATVLIQFYNF